MEGRDFAREKIRVRDKHECQHCHKKWKPGMRRFDVHHYDCDKEKTFQYDDLKKEAPNLVTLCHKCHMNIPAHRRAMEIYHFGDKLVRDIMALRKEKMSFKAIAAELWIEDWKASYLYHKFKF